MQPQIGQRLAELQRQIDALKGRLTGLVRAVQLFSGSVEPAIDAALVGAGLDPTLSGSIDGHFNQLSGTVDARFTNLSGSINSAIAAGGNVSGLSGTVDARFTNLSGTVDGHFNQLSGTVDARFSNFSPSLPATVALAGTTVNAGSFGPANQDAFSHFANGVSVVLCSAGGGAFLMNGITSGSAGRVVALFNTGSANNISLVNDTVAAAAGNRIYTVGAGTTNVGPGSGIILWYDGTTAHWRTLSRT